jgi:hypothetical protein
MFEVRHQVPGRLRLHFPALRADARLAASLRGHLQACDGVRAVRINPACASVVIAHDARHLSAELLQQRLRELVPAAPSKMSAASTISAAKPSLALSRRARMLGWLRRNAANPAPKGSAATVLEAPSPAVAMLCRINWRLGHWMLRQTLKCWWNGELGRNQARAMAASRLALMPRPR